MAEERIDEIVIDGIAAAYAHAERLGFGLIMVEAPRLMLGAAFLHPLASFGCVGGGPLQAPSGALAEASPV